jgi:iron complex outermembrane receptor protein
MNKQLFRKSAITLAIISASTIFISPTFAAQEDTEVKEEVEYISVTGSRINRTRETPSPVQDLDFEALNKTGAMSLGEVLQELPSVGSSLNGNGSGGTSHGSSSLNLRNLGANRSLVLVNGQRWVNGAGTRGFRDFVDMNTIPQAIVNRVEVLQDGATAIYGADAIAGVVNIYTHSDYVGTSIKAYYGQASEGDRETSNIDFLWGKDIGESNLMFAASFSDQKPIYTQDRELTAVPLNGLTGYTPEGFFREDDLATLGLGFDGSDITRDFGADSTDLSNWRDPVDADEYNRYDNNYVVGPSERTALYAQYLAPVGDINVRIEALYNKRVSDQQFSQVLSSVRGSRGFTIANDPAVNPFGVEFSGDDFRVSQFMTDNDYRVNEQNVETTRLGIGADGDLSDDWSWDTYFSWAQNKGEFTSNNQLHLDKLALGLLNCDTSGIAVDVSDLETGCVGVNLFEPLTTAMVNYINFTGHDKNKASQIDFTLNATGSLFELPAGELAMAVGIEYRKEKGEDVPDSTIGSDPRVNSYRTTSSSPRLGTIGEYDLKEAYAEFSIPLLEGESFAEYLELSLATRFSDYSTFGSTTNSKAGILYTPTEGLSFRATWAEGFRAPSILELFEGERASVAPITDPCSTDKTLPGCVGIPANYTQVDSNVPITTGGNAFLQPETSENTSVGLIYIPTYIDNFSITLDWYDIEIENTISEFGYQEILDLCSSENRNCDVISRDSLGEITNIIDGPINLNSTSVSGMDVVMSYAIDHQSGQWDFSANFSKLDELTEVSTLSDGTTQEEDLVGTAASRESYPEWRGSISANWKQNDWFAAYSARYIGETTEMVSDEPRNISAITYHNISGGYHLDNGLTVKLGINNIADKQPPSSLTNTNINYDQNTYNSVGRFFYVQLNYKM